MKRIHEHRYQVKAKFLDGYTVSLADFYQQYSTADLIRLRAGWEYDFDLACGGDPYRQPKEWLQDRLALVDRIMQSREADRPRDAGEKMWESVESRSARAITKFNR